VKRACIGPLWACVTLVAGRSRARALSCVPFEDRYALQCSGGACEVAFRAVLVTSLVGGGLIAGDSIAALVLGIIGLLSLL